MNHDLEPSLLVHYVDGTLQGSDLIVVEAHLATCRDCSGWVESYRALEGAMRPQDHPTSLEIAQLAVDPTKIDSEESQHTLSHLVACRSCRQEFDLTREALAAGRALAEDERSRPQMFSALLRHPRRVAIAAGLLVGVLAVGFLLVDSGRRDRSFTSGTIRGQEVIEAVDQLVIDNVEVANGGQLVARAKQSVALGDGFSVDSGGSLTIEVTAASASLVGQSEANHTQTERR